MSQSPDEISIHAKKFFKVILDGIDPSTETPESFALKLSTRTRVSIPRLRALTSRLPCTVKSHLTAAQANRLKDLLEDVGGVVRIEAHLVTPNAAGGGADERSVQGRSLRPEDGAISCPDCGWEAERGATYCSLCLRKFRKPGKRGASLEDRLPEKNPLDPDWDPSSTGRRRALRGPVQYLLLVVLGAAAVLAVFVLTK